MDRSFELYLRIAATRLDALPDLEEIVRALRPSALLLTQTGTADGVSIRALAQAVQRLDLALLIENDVRLAKELDADGVHLRAGSMALPDVRRLLGEDKSIGVSCVLSRHDAMEMAEDGADYIAFGEYGLEPGAEADAVTEMVEWWSPLFEVPCVAWVHEGDDDETVRRLAEAGADYLCMELDGGGLPPLAKRLAQLAGAAPPRHRT